MYITTTYRTMCRKLQRCFRFSYLKFKKRNIINNKQLIYSSTPLVSDVITDQINSDGKFNIIQFTESHIESVLFTYFLYKSLGMILNSTSTIVQHLD